VEGVNSSRIYLIHCKNFCKCHNVLQPSTTIKDKIILKQITKKEPGDKIGHPCHFFFFLRWSSYTHIRSGLNLPGNCLYYMREQKNIRGDLRRKTTEKPS
jgi:hypothetical protein